MAECARCGDFTDNPEDGQYQYCDGCLDEFNAVREHGVVVEQNRSSGDYHVYVTADSDQHDGGVESSQVDGLARGKKLADELNLDALFEYKKSGSVWLLDEYLQSHPSIRTDVRQRLSRVPSKSDQGLLAKLKSLF